ncbi:hypothetical protein ABZX75_33320 [Streptomyces sp. NPDC003038]|uniref:hypothetical protein n=1 Tax=unclassified Streptomyces TaxID=2593676 RepID=UPI00339FC777
MRAAGGEHIDYCRRPACGSSALVSAGGELDEDTGETLQQALEDVVPDTRHLLVNLQHRGQ